MGDRNNVIFATAAHDGLIKFWHAATGVVSRTIHLNQGETHINCMTTTPDKQCIAVGGYSMLRLYDARTANNNNPVVNYTGHVNNVTSVGFQRDGKWLYSGSEDGTVKLWDPRTGSAIRDIPCKSPITSVALHPNQAELVVTDDDGSVRVWDLTANKCALELVPSDGVSCRSVSITGDGTLMAVGNNSGTCFVWKLDQRASMAAPLMRLESSNTFLTKVLFSPNSRLLATCGADKQCRLWDCSQGFELQTTLTGHHGWVWDVTFSADSAYLITASSDKLAKLWDLRGGSQLIDYRGHGRGLSALTLNDT